MNRQTEELIEAIKELDNAFNEWNAMCMQEGEFDKRMAMARALGKVNARVFILEQHSEHLYGTENSQG